MGGDYGEALGAMTTFMVQDLELPQVEGVVWFYPTRSSFESALAADYVNDLKQVEKQFGTKGKEAFEQTINTGQRKPRRHPSQWENIGECWSMNGIS